MPYYTGPDGRIYNHPVAGGTEHSGGNIPPRPGNTPYEPRPPVTEEAGFFRKAIYWIASLGSAYGIARGMGQFLCTRILMDSSLDGIVGGVSDVLVNISPFAMYAVALLACLTIGIDSGERHNYNLAALILTVFAAAGICLFTAVCIALLPYATALLLILFGVGLVIGIIAGIFGG